MKFQGLSKKKGELATRRYIWQADHMMTTISGGHHVFKADGSGLLGGTYEQPPR
jgi:hypothetical protein